MKLPKIFHMDLINVHHAAFWLAFFSLVSAVLGLFRDRMLASLFGASRSLDIYYSAFRIPDFLYSLMLFFAASTVIIPIFLDDYKENKQNAEKLFGSVLFFFIVVIFVLSSFAFFLMPYMMRRFLPGFSLAEQTQAIFLSRVMLLSPFFLGLSNIFSSITQAFRRFFVYALSPVIYNIGIIIGIVFFLPRFGLSGLAWGVALGAFFHVVVQSISIIQVGLVPRWGGFWNKDLRRVLLLSFPRALGLATTQIATIIFTGIASTLAAGSISIFNFASNLQAIPVTLIGLSYSMAAFPNLTEYALTGAFEKFKTQFSIAFRHIIFWTIPFTVLLMVLRAQIVRVILGAGKFNWNDTRLTAATLFLLSSAIVVQSLFMLLVRAFYAKNQTMRPLIINIVSAGLSIGMVFWFVKVMQTSFFTVALFKFILHLQDIADIRILAIPLAILIGSLVNFILLLVAFSVIFNWVPWEGSGTAIGKIIIASIGGGGVAYGVLNVLSRIFNLTTFIGVFAQGFFAGIIGLSAITLLLWVLQSEELTELYSGMRGILWKDHIPTPEPEKLP